ncbi:MAG: hypothetical protein HZA53_16885 [Planctomycetes bacterium]|nr:hypothetical protein [Planctomycetota bacterium]
MIQPVSILRFTVFGFLATFAAAQNGAYLQPMAPSGGILRPSQMWIDPTGQNDLDSDAIAWENFTFAQTTTITRVRWWGEASPGLGFEISFINQDPNCVCVQPDLFGPPIYQQVFPVVSQVSVGGSMYQFDVTLATPVTFQANTRYFLTVIGQQPIAFAYWNWASSPNGTSGTFWWQRGLHMYFNLSDNRAMGLATADGFPLGSAFCLGDGSALPCPCGNASPVGSNSGCLNSSGVGGSLSATGTASVASDSAKLWASGMTGASCVFFQGSAQGTPVVVDDGIGCVGGSIVRLGTKPLTAGGSAYPQAGDTPISVRGAIPAAGGTYYYQCFYRNASASFCPPATSNRTNGVAVSWTP